MEKQRLMSDEEEQFLVRNDMNMRTRSEKSKETYRQCDRRSNNHENSHNSFLEGKSLTSEHQKQQNKSNNFMSAFSDFFGLKSSANKANGSSNCSSLVVSVLIAFLYVACAVFLSNGCESLVVSATPVSSGRQPSMFHCKYFLSFCNNCIYLLLNHVIRNVTYPWKYSSLEMKNDIQ